MVLRQPVLFLPVLLCRLNLTCAFPLKAAKGRSTEGGGLRQLHVIPIPGL